MIVWNTLVLAFQAIWRNKVRSFLTMLGVVIGVASVIAMVQLGQSATHSVTGQIANMGPNLLMVMPGVERHGPGAARGEAQPFTAVDARAIAEEVSDVRVAPAVNTRAVVVQGSGNYTTTITGSTNEFLPVRSWTLAQGRLFESRELESGAAVCILGQVVVDELFGGIGGQEPIGTKIRVERTPCEVIGVLASKGQTLGANQDDTILMPLAAVQRRLVGNDDVNVIYVSAAEAAQTDEVKREIDGLMRKRRGIAPGSDADFYVRDMQELAQALQGTTATLTALLGAIAAVSLLVGGIGIMNIMLVAVTERTREIGIRLAIGARAREVLLQFLVEAVVLCVFGGLLGIAFGVGGTVLLARRLDMPLVLSPEIILVSFVVSALIGVVFGFVPARKAARLNPIDALRHE